MSATPPPVPNQPGMPARKKPSALASCILLGLILGVLAVLGGGGFFAYKTFLAKPKDQPAPQESQEPATKPGTSEPSVAQTEPKEPRTRPAGILEVPATHDETPKSDPLAAQVEEPVAEPSIDPTPATETPAPDSVVMAHEPAAEVSHDSPASTLPEPEVVPEPADPDPIVAEQPVQTFAEDSAEVVALKADADRRIDEAPGEVYSDEDKQRVREAIRRAKRLTRVATLQFGTGSTALGGNEKGRLKKALLTPEAETLLSDPQAVFFILGFADSTGTSDLNRTVSQKRASGVADVLKGYKIPNTSYSVGIGSTTLLSTEKQSRNRAAEVWIVLP